MWAVLGARVIIDRDVKIEHARIAHSERLYGCGLYLEPAIGCGLYLETVQYGCGLYLEPVQYGCGLYLEPVQYGCGLYLEPVQYGCGGSTWSPCNNCRRRPRTHNHPGHQCRSAKGRRIISL